MTVCWSIPQNRESKGTAVDGGKLKLKWNAGGISAWKPDWNRKSNCAVNMGHKSVMMLRRKRDGRVSTKNHGGLTKSYEGKNPKQTKAKEYRTSRSPKESRCDSSRPGFTEISLQQSSQFWALWLQWHIQEYRESVSEQSVTGRGTGRASHSIDRHTQS